MGLARLPQVVQHASVHVPFVSGVFRPALILPDSWTGWDASTRRAVLTHELSHLVRRDLWTMRAASLYCAVTWLNPMSWWLRRKLETLAERASDDAVLASGVDPTAYAEMLLQFFAAAQCAPGRADWRLAMARRGGAEAGKRVGRVLNAREGGNVRFGIAGRVLIGLGVVLAAVPAITLSASGSDIVAIQAVDRGLDLRRAQVAPITSGSENQAALRPMTRQQIKQLKLDRVNLTPVLTRELELFPQAREQEQEPEPWRSTRKGTDADVVAPEMTRSVNPKYTADALRAKIEGWITVEAIVSPEGNVTAARVIKSLDRVFGLDDEAVKTAMLWKFLPGSYQGQPVALRVIIEMQFTMRRN